MDLPIVTLKNASHNDKEVVQIFFKRNNVIMQLLRGNNNLLWSKRMSCWYLPYTKSVKQDLFQLLTGAAFLNYDCLSNNPVSEKDNSGLQFKQTTPNPAAELQALSEEAVIKSGEFREWLLSKRYSLSTVNTYCDALKTFLRYYTGKALAEISNSDVILFNNHYILANKFSASFQNQVVNAIKLFFSIIENKKIDPDLIHRPKRAKLLPNVLSKQEIKLILQALSNIKHKAMLSLIYSCGLRRAELLNLRLRDIDSNRNLIIIRQSKGRKDRIAPLSEKILILLRDYFVAYKPKVWLFEGQGKKDKYDERSLACVLKQALEKSKINKPVTLHWLRHSYATHLLENGTDLRYIQEILGHSSSRTTEIYTHVSNKSIQRIISPFDSL